jgi:hypothetical protein
MALTTIEPTEGLGRADRRRAHRAGPSAVAVRTSYPSLFSSAGLIDVEHRDVTPEYRSTLAAWMRALEARAGPIVDAIGEPALRERLTTGRRALAAIDDGLLRRSIYRTVAP